MRDSIEINSGKNDSSFIRHLVSGNWYLTIITYSLSFVLLFAGIAKIIDPTSLIENLSSVFPFLPETFLVLIATLVPLIEVVLGVFLLVYGVKGVRYKSIRLVLVSTAALFGIFFLYSFYGFIIGNHADCGCFGNVVKSSFGWGMIVRNTVLIFIALINLKYFKGVS